MTARMRRVLQRSLSVTLVAFAVAVATVLAVLYVPEQPRLTVGGIPLWFIRPWCSWTRALLTILAVVLLWFMARSLDTWPQGGCYEDGLCY